LKRYPMVQFLTNI